MNTTDAMFNKKPIIPSLDDKFSIVNSVVATVKKTHTNKNGIKTTIARLEEPAIKK